MKAEDRTRDERIDAAARMIAVGLGSLAYYIRDGEGDEVARRDGENMLTVGIRHVLLLLIPPHTEES